MSYEVFPCEEAHQTMDAADAQLSGYLVVQMESDFDEALTETDYKKRAKATKAFNRTIQEITPVCGVLNPMQIRFMQIRTNLGFLLENAHNRVSFKAAAKYFAEYDFLAKEIKKEAKKCNVQEMKDFIESAPVLNTNFFQVMMNTVEVMKANMLQRMSDYPEQYLDLDPEVDSAIDIEEIKKAFKDKQKDLKEEKDKLSK